MTQISKTRIATSDPVNICKGLALFPQIGTSRAGVSVSSNSGNLFNTNDTLLLWRLSANAGFEIFMGVCGPAYGVRMDLEGKAENRTIELTVSNDELAAGFFIGCNVRLYFNIILDENTPHWVWDGWNSHLELQWERLAVLRPEIRVDMIDLILTVIRLALDEQGSKDTLLQKANSITPALLGTWGLYDDRANTFVSNGGKMIVKPTFNIPIDIVSRVPALNAVNEALKPFFCRFSAGFQIGVQIPVTVEMKKVKLDTTEYTGLAFKDGKVSGTSTGNDPDSPREIKVELDHTPGFDLTLGVFANLNLCKLFNINASEFIPVLSQLGIKVKLGTYPNELSNTIGSTNITACGCGQEDGAALVDVIFEKPEGLAI